MTTKLRTLVGAAAVVAAATTAALPVGSAVARPSAHSTAKPAWRVSISANKATVTLGHKVWVHGHVGANDAGRYVRLEEKYSSDKPWRLQRLARVRADGTYTTWDKPTRNHPRHYRVVAPAAGGHSRGVSTAISVDVYQWIQLTSVPSVNNAYFSKTSVDVNGVTFPGSLEGWPVGDPAEPVSTEYNLDHLCTAFRGTFAIADDSESGSQGSIGLTADGSALYSGTFGVGQSSYQQFRFATAPLKLHIDGASLVSGASAHPALATPEVLCTEEAE